jgi:hypothetical protein
MKPKPCWPLQAALFAASALAQVPAGYPADYQKIVDARQEGRQAGDLRRHRQQGAQPLIKDFNALYPGITVEYNDMNSTEVYNRFISEAAAGGNTADVTVVLGDGPADALASDGYALPTNRSKRARSRAGRTGTTWPTAPPSSRPPSSTTSAWSTPRKCRRPTPISSS